MLPEELKGNILKVYLKLETFKVNNVNKGFDSYNDQLHAKKEGKDPDAKNGNATKNIDFISCVLRAISSDFAELDTLQKMKIVNTMIIF